MFDADLANKMLMSYLSYGTDRKLESMHYDFEIMEWNLTNSNGNFDNAIFYAYVLANKLFVIIEQLKKSGADGESSTLVYPTPEQSEQLKWFMDNCAASFRIEDKG